VRLPAGRFRAHPGRRAPLHQPFRAGAPAAVPRAARPAARCASTRSEGHLRLPLRGLHPRRLRSASAHRRAGGGLRRRSRGRSSSRCSKAAPCRGCPAPLIGAGTGLGVAALLPEGDGWRTVGGEGGHIGFSPADEDQLAVWRHLRGRAGASRRKTSSPARASPPSTQAWKKSVPARRRSPTRRRSWPPLRHDPVAQRALEIFIAAYGAFAGDLALLFMARGGVYLGGGIAPKILAPPATGRFRRGLRRARRACRPDGGFPDSRRHRGTPRPARRAGDCCSAHQIV
jgi:hypothetical protein